ncbi:MAG: penicillin-binding protein 2 [Pyrinomonadaceae bacterium]
MKQVAYTRFMLVVAFFVLWIGGISVRLVHLQVTQHDWLRERAEDGRTAINHKQMLRGTIYDRNNRALAMSLRVKTLYADPTEMADTNAAAQTIAKALKIDEKLLATQLRQAKDSKKRYVPIAKKLDEEVSQKLNKVFDTPDARKPDLPRFNGLHWQDDQKRSYPLQSIAAHIIGFSNDKNDGVAGIEQSQDDLLHGAIIKSTQERDRLGRVYEEDVAEREAPSDVYLTIDYAMQYMVEQSLEKGVREADAKSGVAVVMNPKTGEVLALANYPTFDPNTITPKTSIHITNNAVQSAYALGSVFKLVTYSTGLEKKLFNPNDMISAGNGTIDVANHVFTDSHGVGTVSYAQALAHSSNVCAIKTALSIGKEDFFGMVQKMGFGAKTGIELPAETAGLLKPTEKWNGDSLASMAIGYEIGVSPLQMASAFATIANNGIRVQPRIIKTVKAADGSAAELPQAQQTQVVTPETAQKMRTMLKQVVLTGTGKRAQLNGYTAAGKTGTAWKTNAKGTKVDSSKYMSTFIGMAPADDPEIVVAVIMDEPKNGARDGGMVSAPVFREIAQQLLHELKVPTDAPIKLDRLAAKDEVSELPVKDTVAKKTTEPRSESNSPKRSDEVPAEKEKSKDLKKSKDKKTPENGRLTATLFRRVELVELIGRIEIET